MRTALFTAVLFVAFLSGLGRAQQEPLAGRWEGTAQTPQGELKASITFKKDAGSYSGTMSRLRGDGDLPLSNIKLIGDRVTAQSDIESPEGSFSIKFDLVLKGETLKGKAELSFGGQTYELAYDLERGGPSAQPAGAAGSAQGAQPAGPARRPVVPQPQQKQSLDYFAGQWSFTRTERESPLGPGGPSEGTAVFTYLPDNKFLERRIDSRSETGESKETALIGFDEDAKLLAFTEHRAGAELFSLGDWRSPVAIRFRIAPFTVGGHALRLRRTISVISAFSYTVTEELSVDGGPFERLGQGLFSKVAPPSAQK